MKLIFRWVFAQTIIFNTCVTYMYFYYYKTKDKHTEVKKEYPNGRIANYSSYWRKTKQQQKIHQQIPTPMSAVRGFIRIRTKACIPPLYCCCVQRQWLARYWVHGMQLVCHKLRLSRTLRAFCHITWLTAAVIHTRTILLMSFSLSLALGWPIIAAAICTSACVLWVKDYPITNNYPYL